MLRIIWFKALSISLSHSGYLILWRRCHPPPPLCPALQDMLGMQLWHAMLWVCWRVTWWFSGWHEVGSKINFRRFRILDLRYGRIPWTRWSFDGHLHKEKSQIWTSLRTTRPGPRNVFKQYVMHWPLTVYMVVSTQLFQAYLVWAMAFGQMSSMFCSRPKCPDRIFLTATSCLEFLTQTPHCTCSKDPRPLLLRWNLWTWYALILMQMEWLRNWSNARRKDIP